jgi:hypothetical protein
MLYAMVVSGAAGAVCAKTAEVTAIADNKILDFNFIFFSHQVD